MTTDIQKFDLLIKNGEVAFESGPQKLNIGIVGNKIASINPKLSLQADQSIDASGNTVFAGFIDAHTHMGIPIMNTTSADDFDSGSIAAAFGGVTTILDFTVQEKGQSPGEAVENRIRKAQNKCHIDYGVHVNVTDHPERWLAQIPQLIEEGFISFKVFSTYRQAGMMIDWDQFRQVLKQVDSHGGLLMLHAEDNEITESLTDKHLNSAQFDPIFHPRSRPSEAEALAIENASRIAGELDARLYIVHLSTRKGLETALKARDQGVKLYLETCPQYLLLSEEKYLQDKGHYYITTPPLRTKADSEALWRALADGHIDVVATDHSPFTIEQKNAGNGKFHLTPNGIPGVETLFPLLYTYGVEQGRISLPRLLQVLGKNPAQIFGISHRKGEIREGADADLVIWNPEIETKISANELHGNADWSPYEGMPISGKLEYTMAQGNIIVEGEDFKGESRFGELLLTQSMSK
jgi:dihydropyrimidinase